jgi:hypothetical protein
MKTFLRNHANGIRKIKAVVAVLLSLMVVIDVVLVMLEKQNYPTFSWVVRDHRPRLIWLTFLFGGLIAKIFYNREVPIKDKEVTGALAFFSVVAMLLVLGFSLEKVDRVNELIIMICGGIVAYRIWPQYTDPIKNPPQSNRSVSDEFMPVSRDVQAKDETSKK